MFSGWLSARITKKILHRLRYSNEIIETVTLLVDKHMFAMGVTDKGLRRLIKKATPEHIYELLEVRRADIIAQGKGADGKDVDEFEKWVRLEIERKPPFGLKDLKINGDMIMEKFGLQPGPPVGKVLNHLLEKVLDEPEFNEDDKLLKEAEEFLRKNKLLNKG